jgi:gamma-D-glutamyl-L-lysine dipeptidyl-peptidase
MKKLIVATNLTDLHKGPSFLDELLTQIVNGSSVEVLEETNEKWVRVREEGGYEGFVYRHYLAESAGANPTHITLTNVELVADPFNEKSHGYPGTRLCLGTRVHVLETREQQCRITPAGGLPGGWVSSIRLRALASLPLAPDVVRHNMIHYSRELTGTYYLWGGNSEWGTDCSGLVMMTHRLAGYTIPRDAWMQHRDARMVDTAQRGDLFFFWNDARSKISHVGICTGGWNMIHSSRARNGVYEEDIQKNPNLMSSFAGAGTFLP